MLKSAIENTAKDREPHTVSTCEHCVKQSLLVLHAYKNHYFLLILFFFFFPFLPFSLSCLAFPEARLFSSLVVHKNNFNYNQNLILKILLIFALSHCFYFQGGCITKLENFILNHLQIIGAVGVGIACVQVSQSTPPTPKKVFFSSFVM